MTSSQWKQILLIRDGVCQLMRLKIVCSYFPWLEFKAVLIPITLVWCETKQKPLQLSQSVVCVGIPVIIYLAWFTSTSKSRKERAPPLTAQACCSCSSVNALTLQNKGKSIHGLLHCSLSRWASVSSTSPGYPLCSCDLITFCSFFSFKAFQWVVRLLMFKVEIRLKA